MGHFAVHFSGKAKVDSTSWDEEVDDATHGAEVGVVAVLDAEVEVVADVALHEDALGAYTWADNPAS